MNRDIPQSWIFEEITSELLASGYGFRFQARGRSMFPTIEDGDMVHVRPLGERKLRTGDIVLVRVHQEFKAHRIVQKRGKRLVLRGDAGHDNDGTFVRDQILGLVIAKESVPTGSVVWLGDFRPRLAFRLREVSRQFHLTLNFLAAHVRG